MYFSLTRRRCRKTAYKVTIISQTKLLITAAICIFFHLNFLMENLPDQWYILKESKPVAPNTIQLYNLAIFYSLKEILKTLLIHILP